MFHQDFRTLFDPLTIHPSIRSSFLPWLLRLDRDGSGVLTFDDVAVACEAFGIMLTADQKSGLFSMFDKGRQGYITYADFVNHVALVPHDIVDIPHPHAPEARCSTPQVLDEMRDRLKEGVLASRPRIEALFRWFDKGNTKKISYGAFRDKIRSLQLPLQDHHIKEMWTKFGSYQKGAMDFGDFVEKMLDFNLSGLPISHSTLVGAPNGTPIPGGEVRASPVFDLGRTQIGLNEPKTGRVSVSPFGSRQGQRRPNTASVVQRRNAVGSRQQQQQASAPRHSSKVDMFGQAENDLESIHGRKKVTRQDNSFKADSSMNRPRTGQSRGASQASGKWGY